MPPPDEVSFDPSVEQQSVPTEDEKASMKRVRDAGAVLRTEILALHSRVPTDDPTTMQWELQNAYRAVEEAVFWATKHAPVRY